MGRLIEWPMARYWHRAWNPVIGCKPVSPACEHCWASGWADRFKQDFKPRESCAKTPPRRGVVFCGNLTDLWGDWNLVHEEGGSFHKPGDWIVDTLGSDEKNPYKDKAVYLWLTKRVENMARTLLDSGLDTRLDLSDCDLSNQYFGFTAESQEWYDKRIPDFREINPRVVNLWLSAEPLLGPIDLGLRYIAPEDQPFKWVVVGCESGPDRRPCKVEWVEAIVAECRGAGVPVFVKQLDLGGRCETDISKFPAHLRIRQVPWWQKEAW